MLDPTRDPGGGETPPQLPIGVLALVTALLAAPLAIAIAKVGYTHGGLPLAAGSLVALAFVGVLTRTSARY